jgi:serine/threonine protein kinase
VLVDSQSRARLTDFGLATSLHATATTATNGRGTIRYMAPELLVYEEPESTGRATKESDTYATAITVWRASDVFWTCASWKLNALQVYSDEIPFATSKNDIAVATRVLKNERPLRTPEMNGRGMTDQLWARVTRWWSQDPIERGRFHDARDPISAAQARRLLDSIRRLSFSNPTHTDAIFTALNELAWWSEADPDDDLAVEWIVRIYPVRNLT